MSRLLLTLAVLVSVAAPGERYTIPYIISAVATKTFPKYSENQ